MFIYKINDVWWLIIDTHHYYYNIHSKESFWQLPNSIDFNDLNINEILILIAKYNGLKIKDKEEQQQKEQQEEEQEEEEEQEQQRGEEVVEQEAVVEDEDEREEVYVVEEKDDIENGLDLGYLSSADEEDEGTNDVNGSGDDNGSDNRSGNGNENETTKEDGKRDEDEIEDDEEGLEVNVDDLVNDILNEGVEHATGEDLDPELELEDGELDEGESDEGELDEGKSDVDNDSEGDTAGEFKSLLDSLKDQISPYDPYSITEESIISELSQTAIYYKLTPNQRESLYNAWCNENLTTGADKYPSPKQLLMNYLFDHKSEIKSGKKYYVDFKSRLSRFKIGGKEDIFLRYKLVLENQSKFEKSVKKVDKSVNLKKVKVIEFINSKLTKSKLEKSKRAKKVNFGDFEPVGNGDGDGDWDKWIKLCNVFNLPDDIVENEINWIVGPTKRLECYLELMK